MIAALAETFIQKFCGRYLKNFSTNNVSIGITGTITLIDVEFQLDSFADLQYPYKPCRAFIGQLRADLPLVPGANFDIYISDVLVLFHKDEGLANDEDNAVLAIRALQTLIGVFYTELKSTSEFFYQVSTGRIPTKISTSDLENGQLLLDRFVIVLERLHIRSEEEFTSHIPCPVGQEIVSIGILVDKIEFRGPNSTELSKMSENWQNAKKDGISVNKILYSSGCSIYCTRDQPMHQIPDEEFTGEYVRKHYYIRTNAMILCPFAMTITLSVIYQKLIHSFGPIKINITFDDVVIRISDEQIAYLMKFFNVVINYVQVLQYRSRKHLYTSRMPKSDTNRKARHRWLMIRDAIKQDYFRYVTKDLDSGSIRWRIWFEQWRYVARYIALREILMFHCGFEPKYHPMTGSIVYSFAECLVTDHNDIPSSSKEKENNKNNEITLNDNVNDPKVITKLIYRYQGRSILSANQMKVSEVLISKLLHQVGPYSSPDKVKETIDPMVLSVTALRSLYALQLEYDCLLPLRVCAMARVWAEDRYRSTLASVPTENISTMSIRDRSLSNTIAITSPQKTLSSSPSITLLLAIVDGTGLRPSFGMSKVEAYCTIQPVAWNNTTTNTGILYSETRSANVGVGSDTALLSWGQILSIPISTDTLSYFINSSLSSSNNTGAGAGAGTSVDMESIPSFRIDCEGIGYLNFSYGKGYIPIVSSFDLPTTMTTIANSTAYESSIYENTITLKRESTGITLTTLPIVSNQEKDSLDISIRIMTMIVIGENVNAVISKLQNKVNEAVSDKQQVVLRQEQLARREKMNESNMEEEEVFILDPSVVSVQDLQIQTRIPSFSVIIDTLYHIPANTRSNIFKSTGDLMPYSIPIPICKLSLKGFVATLIASSNPWSGKIQASLDKFRLWELQTVNHNRKNSVQEQDRGESRVENHDMKVPDKSSYPVVNIRSISFTADFTQISTMSPYISGMLDLTCFDWSGQLSIFPMTIRLSSRGGNSSNSSIIKLWESDRILSHLWNPISEWSLGGGMSQNPPQASTRLKPEARTRHGDSYTRYPKHMSVIKEVSGRIKYQTTTLKSNVKDGIDFPNQHTIFSMNTLSRSLDADIMILPDSIVEETMKRLKSSDGSGDSSNNGNSNKQHQSKAVSTTTTTTTTTSSVGTDLFTDFFGNVAQATTGAFITGSVSTNINNVKRKDSWSEEADEYVNSDDEKMTAATGSSSSSNVSVQPLGGFFDWMGTSLTPVTDSSSKGKQATKRGNNADNSSPRKNSTAFETWNVERAELNERIRELEAQNRLLLDRMKGGRK